MSWQKHIANITNKAARHAALESKIKFTEDTGASIFWPDYRMSAVSSARKRGDTSYDLLCRGLAKSYSYNLVDLTNIVNDYQHLSCRGISRKIRNTLIKQVDNIFETIAVKQTNKEIHAYTIGKSHARKRLNVIFDENDPETWALDDGINGRWKEYAKNGYSGLIALVAITEKVNPVKKGNFANVEQYAIRLEQQLIHHYAVQDTRCENKSCHPGNLCDSKNPPYAGIVYVAYKLRDKVNSQEADVEDNDDASQSNLGDDEDLDVMSCSDQYSEEDSPFMIPSIPIKKRAEGSKSISAKIHSRQLTPYHTVEYASERLGHLNHLDNETIDHTQRNKDTVGTSEDHVMDGLHVDSMVKKRVSIAVSDDQIGSPMYVHELEDESLPKQSILQVTENSSNEEASVNVHIPVKQKYSQELNDSENKKPTKQCFHYGPSTSSASQNPDGRTTRDNNQRKKNNPSAHQLIAPRGPTPAIIQPHQQTITQEAGKADTPVNVSKPRQPNMTIESKQRTTPRGPRTHRVTISVPPQAQMSQPVAHVLQQPSTSSSETAPVQIPLSQSEIEKAKKCKNFLMTVIKLASNAIHAPETVQNVKHLLQNLLDGRTEPEEFTQKLQKELHSSPQPYLVPFLKKSLPLLRQTLPYIEERIFLNQDALKERVNRSCQTHGLQNASTEVIDLISFAAQTELKTQFRGIRESFTLLQTQHFLLMMDKNIHWLSSMPNPNEEQKQQLQQYLQVKNKVVQGSRNLEMLHKNIHRLSSMPNPNEEQKQQLQQYLQIENKVVQGSRNLQMLHENIHRLSSMANCNEVQKNQLQQYMQVKNKVIHRLHALIMHSNTQLAAAQSVTSNASITPATQQSVAVSGPSGGMILQPTNKTSTLTRRLYISWTFLSSR
ncbi:uncharacterized protein [Amphiura filiformis]|uniref:uncharacterized protein n=1 Tax=Amphiura filiformis TaxID=82378 RepID=UPI003B20B88F